MELQISAKLQGVKEAYNIFIDDEKIIKVRGDKVTTLNVSDEPHTLQLKSGSGKSSIINIGKPDKENEIVKLNFSTSYARAFREGYFKLEDN